MTPDRVTTDGHDSYPRAIRTELGNFLRPRTRHNQHVPADRRQPQFLRRMKTVLGILEAA